MTQTFKKSMVEHLVDSRAPRTGRKLSYEDQLVIVWGTYRGWNTKRIADMIPSSSTLVLNYLREWDEQPVLILDLPVLTRLSKNELRCDICGETRPTETKIYRHVLAHIVEKVTAMYTPLNDYKRL